MQIRKKESKDLSLTSSVLISSKVYLKFVDTSSNLPYNVIKYSTTGTTIYLLLDSLTNPIVIIDYVVPGLEKCSCNRSKYVNQQTVIYI